MLLQNNKSDNVDFKHPDYLTHAMQVDMVYNIFRGIDSATRYLSQAPREEITSFEERMAKATLKNYVKRATEAFVGMIFRKQVEITGFDEKIVEVTKKIDKKSTLNRFSRSLTTALVRDGKVHIAVDTPVGGGQPYFSILERLSVINWRKDETGRYTMLVYKETIAEENGDFGLDELTQWRVFKDDGNVEIWREAEGKNEYYIYDYIETEYDYIPVVTIELDDIPPLYDIAKLNIKHMNRTSLKDKYLDMAAIPIPVIWDTAGIMDEQEVTGGTKPVKVIGVDEAFVLSGSKDEADFQWRELTGSSISALQNDLSVIEEDITSGVIRAAQTENNSIKTATQSFYEAAESSNRVTVIANAIETGLNEAMLILADMMNLAVDQTAELIVNKDFNAIMQGTDALRLLWEVYLEGGVSTETFLKSLQQFEVIDISSTADEIERILADNFKLKPKVKKIDTTNIDNRTVSAMETE